MRRLEAGADLMRVVVEGHPLQIVDGCPDMCTEAPDVLVARFVVKGGLGLLKVGDLAKASTLAQSTTTAIIPVSVVKEAVAMAISGVLVECVQRGTRAKEGSKGSVLPLCRPGKQRRSRAGSSVSLDCKTDYGTEIMVCSRRRTTDLEGVHKITPEPLPVRPLSLPPAHSATALVCRAPTKSHAMPITARNNCDTPVSTTQATSTSCHADSRSDSSSDRSSPPPPLSPLGIRRKHRRSSAGVAIGHRAQASPDRGPADDRLVSRAREGSDRSLGASSP